MPATCPTTIPLNPFERYFLIPKTDDLNGDYFPMYMAQAFTLREALSAQGVVAALKHVDNEFPQLRLGYRLDYARNRLTRISDDERNAYFEEAVILGEPAPADALVTQAISTNIRPFSRPLEIWLHGNVILFKGQHSLYDGRTFHWIVTLTLLAATGQDILKFRNKISPEFAVPLWKTVWHTPRLGLQTHADWLQTYLMRRSETQHQTVSSDQAVTNAATVLPPILTCITIQPQSMELLDRLRECLSENSEVFKTISLNTVIAALLSQRCLELNLLETPIAYEMQIDLRQYIGLKEFIAGCLVMTMSVNGLSGAPTFAQECRELQTNIDHYFARRLPLAGLPGIWLLALLGKHLEKRLMRSAMASEATSKHRMIPISNYGQFSTLRHVSRLLDLSKGFIFAGSEPAPKGIGIRMGYWGTSGYLNIVRDPASISDKELNAVLEVFSPAYLEDKLAQVTGQANFRP